MYINFFANCVYKYWNKLPANIKSSPTVTGTARAANSVVFFFFLSSLSSSSAYFTSLSSNSAFSVLRVQVQ